MALEFNGLEVSDHVVEKINSLHHVTLDEVLDVLETPTQAVWDDDPERGRRLYVLGQAGTRVIFVCLWPLDAERGEWRLVTAYPE